MSLDTILNSEAAMVAGGVGVVKLGEVFMHSTLAAGIFLGVSAIAVGARYYLGLGAASKPSAPQP
jgi:hypothetical protein